MMALHAATPPSPAEVTITAVLGVYRKHSDMMVFTGSVLLGLGITADVIMASILLHWRHMYDLEMLLLLGGFALAASVAAWIYIDYVQPAVSNWDGHQWDDAGKLPSVEETEVVPVKVAA